MTAGNAINKRCVLCRDSKYIMSRPSALAAPIPLSSSNHISVLPILQMSLIWYQVLVATIDIDWHSLKFIIVSPTKHQQQPSNQLRSVDLSVRHGWSKSVDLDFEKQFYNIRVTFPRTPGRQGEPSLQYVRAAALHGGVRLDAVLDHAGGLHRRSGHRGHLLQVCGQIIFCFGIYEMKY